MLNESCPNDQVIKLKALEAMQKIADGQATKIIIPSEIQGLAGLAKRKINADTAVSLSIAVALLQCTLAAVLGAEGTGGTGIPHHQEGGIVARQRTQHHGHIHLQISDAHGSTSFL